MPLRDIVRHQARGDTWFRIVAAIASGALYATAFEPLGWWLAVFPALAIFTWAVLGARFWSGAGIGALFAFVFWAWHIEWLTMYLGLVPWLALALAMTVFYALGSGLGAWVTRREFRRLTHPALIAATWAVIWVAREAIFSRMPYGGFAWGHASWTQSNSPLLSLSSWIGLPALSGVIVFASALPVCWMLQRRPRGRRALVLGVIGVLIWGLIPAWGAVTPATGQLRVAAVQGNANAGLFSNVEAGEILRNHLEASQPIMHDDFDVMVWPENAVDVDVLQSAAAQRAISNFVDEMGRPLVFGSITHRDGEVYNTVLVWQPGQGPTQLYDKRHPVPFAEYMPDRWLWHPIAPDLVDLVPRGFSFGQLSGNLNVAGVNAGALICFETSDADLVRSLVFGGAQVLFAPTNNADFGRSSEAAQQLAITRAQAVASGRSVVNVSTVSSSAIIDAGGETLDALQDFTADDMIETVPLQQRIAPGTIAGVIGDVGAVLAAAVLIIRRFAVGVAERRRAGASL